MSHALFVSVLLIAGSGQTQPAGTAPPREVGSAITRSLNAAPPAAGVPVPAPAARGPGPAAPVTTVAPPRVAPVLAPPAVARPVTPAPTPVVTVPSSPPVRTTVPAPVAAPATAPARAPAPVTTAVPAPAAVSSPTPAPAPAPAPAPVPAAPPVPVLAVLDAPAIAALPFALELPAGVTVTAGRPGPNFNIWTIRRGEQPLVMVYAGPASQFPIYSGEMVEAGGRASVVATEGGRRVALEHLFARTTAPQEIHVWVTSVEGSDRTLAERIGQSVDPR